MSIQLLTPLRFCNMLWHIICCLGAWLSSWPLTANIVNANRIIMLALLIGALVILAGCGSPIDALNGYDVDWTHTRYNHRPLDKAITDDVQKFINSKKIPQSDISQITYGEDATGRHVAMIIQEIPASHGMEINDYILYYDKHNLRKSVRTFHSRRSC